MIDLDDLQQYTLNDPGGMLRHLHNFPSECEAAWEKATSVELPSEFAEVEQVIVCGMGGSAIGGDFVRRLALIEGKLPVWVHRDYGLPPLVTKNTLLVFSSYSGNTEETISSFTESVRTPARKMAITTGGRLAELAAEQGIPLLRIDYRAPPRAAFPHSFMSLAGVFNKLALLQDKSADVQEALRAIADLAVKIAEGAPVTSNPAKQLAQRLHNRLAVIYGAGLLTEVAQRWKGQINENSKAWAFYEALPELNHNAVVGYGLPGDISERAHVVLLYSPLLHPRVSLRYGLTAELLNRDRVSHEMVEAPGDSPLAQVLGLVLFGDYVSYYLAILNGVDPSTVPPIDYLKSQLGDSHLT